ncbi:unnamed protein product, partial [Cuscuta campestris]
MDVVREWFSEQDVVRIHRTPVSLSRKDCWFWVAETHGVYTVKSAYRKLCGEASQVSIFDRSMSTSDLAVFAAGIWAIWKARNHACWELKVVKPEIVAEWACEVRMARAG